MRVIVSIGEPGQRALVLRVRNEHADAVVRRGSTIVSQPHPRTAANQPTQFTIYSSSERRAANAGDNRLHYGRYDSHNTVIADGRPKNRAAPYGMCIEQRKQNEAPAPAGDLQNTFIGHPLKDPTHAATQHTPRAY